MSIKEEIRDIAIEQAISTLSEDHLDMEHLRESFLCDIQIDKDLQFDISDMDEMVLSLENRFNIRISDSDVSGLFTLEDLVRLVEDKIEEGNTEC